VLLNHGSSGGDSKQEVPQTEQAKFFTDRGYVVLVPMRRGRGTSGGKSLESEEKSCDPKSWQVGLDAAYEDVSAAITYAFSLPDVEPSKLVLAGESRGGFLSVAYAAQGSRRKNVVGVINFVGGWVAQAEDNCPIDFNVVAYRKYGSQTRIPELWLYGDHDRFYSTSSIKSYPVAYTKGGGTVAFNLIPNVPENGHWLPGFPDLWSTQVGQYLAARGLPSSKR
jgi:dienelactone hydrolase